jgi:hypothetical protein
MWAFNLLLLASILVPLAMSGPLGSGRQWLIFGGLLLGGVIVFSAWMKRDTGKWLPHRLLGVFSIQSINSDVALDLWQCGITGRQIAEGILLESLERAVPATLIALTILTGLCLTLLLFPSPLPLAAMYTAVILLLGILNFRTAITGFPCGATKDFVPAMIARWRNSDPLTSKIERGCHKFLRGLIYIPVTLLVAGGAIALGFLVVGILRAFNLAESDQGTWLQVIIGVFYLYLTLCGLAFVAIFHQWETQRLEEMLSEADEAFDLYVRQEILQDPDARRSVLDTDTFQLGGEQKVTAHPGEDARLS